MPAKNTDDGIRAVKGAQVIEPDGVRRYLEGKFGDDLEGGPLGHAEARQELQAQGTGRRAYALYEQFRPSIPEGVKGWGAKGDLDLGLIERLAKGK